MRDAIKIGVIADQTGALSIMGGAQANVATLVVDETNAGGGLARPSPRTAHRGQRNRRRAGGRGRHQARPGRPRRRAPGRHLQLDQGGRQETGGGGGRDALHLPRAVRGAGIPPAPLLHRRRCRSRAAPPAARRGPSARSHAPRPASAWQSAPQPVGARQIAVPGVSCPSPRSCVLVGSYATRASSTAALIERYYPQQAWASPARKSVES